MILTGHEEDRSSLSFVYWNCQNLQSVIVTHDAISLFIRFPIVEVVHLLEYATEYDMDVQVNINIYVV